MKKLFSVTALIAVLCMFVLCGCGCEGLRQENENTGKIKILATLFPQYDFARSIAGDAANVELLLPAGVDSHAFDPKMSDIVKAQNADMIIYTGDSMESWAKEFLSAKKEDCTVLDVSKNITLSAVSHGENEEHEEHEEHEHTHNVDPHIWTSPENAITIVEEICGALCEKDPANAEYYRKNADGYVGKLKELSDGFSECAVNANGKKLYFGGRFAFHYLMEEYGFSYMSLFESCSESAEPGVQRLTGLIEDMKKNKAPVVFYPELSEPKYAESIKNATGAEMRLFHSCHNLSKEETEAGETYLSLMEKNLSYVKEALR